MNHYSPAYGLALGQKFLKFGTAGADYIPSPDAPSTYPELIAEWHRACCGQGEEARHLFRVYDGGCASSIYGGPAENHAFRYFHDLVHWTLQAEFDIASEIRVAQQQAALLGELSEEEAWTFRIDTIGQALYNVITGDFLEDQEAFVQWVYKEVRRQKHWIENSTLNMNDIELLTLAVRNYYHEVNN